MNSDLFRHAVDGKLAADMSAYAKWKFTGADRERYLNGQITNDVRLLRPGHTLRAAVCNAKGRMEGIVHVYPGEDALYVTAPSALRESLTARLGKFIIADDVEMTDITDDWQLFFVPHGSVAKEQHLSLAPDSLTYQINRFGVSGTDVWLPANSKSPKPEFAPESIWDALRIIHKIPRWGRDMDFNTLPPEMHLELSAISYNKGCYIGQEVISRLKSVGHVNKLLCLLKAANGKVPALPANCESDGKIIGQATSATTHPQSGELLVLATLQRQFSAAGTKVSIGDTVFTVSV
ncbi:MAG: hypothetical protein LBH01_03220 [Verrucomicrobiales bacterium]|jgi:folate-binding protein YgfZ|nr:hypothetical protein [Verrucomicrobiales bacterium]